MQVTTINDQPTLLIDRPSPPTPPAGRSHRRHDHHHHHPTHTRHAPRRHTTRRNRIMAHTPRHRNRHRSRSRHPPRPRPRRTRPRPPNRRNRMDKRLQRHRKAINTTTAPTDNTPTIHSPPAAAKPRGLLGPAPAGHAQPPTIRRRRNRRPDHHRCCPPASKPTELGGFPRPTTPDDINDATDRFIEITHPKPTTRRTTTMDGLKPLLPTISRLREMLADSTVQIAALPANRHTRQENQRPHRPTQQGRRQWQRLTASAKPQANRSNST